MDKIGLKVVLKRVLIVKVDMLLLILWTTIFVKAEVFFGVNVLDRIDIVLRGRGV